MSTEIKPAAFEMPTTREGFKQLFAELFSETMSNPANANLLAKTLFAATHNALLGAIDKDFRQENKPVIVRQEYPDSWRCTVVGGQGGTLTVTIEERSTDGAWIMADISEALEAKTAGLVLSQTAVAGDVFYLTTSAKIEAARDSFVDQYLADAMSEKDERGAAALLEAAATGVEPIAEGEPVETREVPRADLSANGVVVTQTVAKEAGEA